MLTAITRGVSPRIGDCLLTHMERQTIDAARAAAEQRAYERALRELGVRVTSLPPDDDLPDCAFAEDTALVLDEAALLARMRSPTRAAELDTIAEALAPHREIVRLDAPAHLEGGDTFRIGRTIYVGLSSRTNDAGVEALRGVVERFGYRVAPVAVRGCLHLSTGASYVGGGVVLANPRWVETAAFADRTVLTVPEDEPWAANALLIGETVVMPAGFPRTRELIEGLGQTVRTLNITELMKAEAGLSCLSLRFNTNPAGQASAR